MIGEAYETVVYRWGERMAERLFIDNPWAALWGEDVEIGRPKLRTGKAFLRAVGLGSKRRKRRRRRA